jgi:hypothetical protein
MCTGSEGRAGAKHTCNVVPTITGVRRSTFDRLPAAAVASKLSYDPGSHGDEYRDQKRRFGIASDRNMTISYLAAKLRFPNTRQNKGSLPSLLKGDDCL